MRCVFRRAQAARRKQKAAEEALAYRELARETCEGRPGFAALKLKHENEVTQLKMMGYNEAAALRKRATARFRSVPNLWVLSSGSGSGPGCGSFSRVHANDLSRTGGLLHVTLYPHLPPQHRRYLSLGYTANIVDRAVEWVSPHPIRLIWVASVQPAAVMISSGSRPRRTRGSPTPARWARSMIGQRLRWGCCRATATGRRRGRQPSQQLRRRELTQRCRNGCGHPSTGG